MSSWQRFSSIVWAVSWIWWLFPLLCRSSLVWCSPICLFFLLVAVSFEFGLGSLSLYLSVPEYFPQLLGVVSKKQLILRSLIHFELTLVQSERQGSSSSLLHVDILFTQLHLLKRLSFLHHVFWAPLLKISWL
jgi:hypothetical protein